MDGGAMDLRYPVATWRGALPPPELVVIDLTDRAVIDPTDPAVIDPAVIDPAGAGPRLIITAGHGCLQGAEGPAELGICGPWDDDDGAVWQWLPIGPADVVVLTSDGGDGQRPWSARQLGALTELGAWWCRQSGQPSRLVRTAMGGGVAAAGALAGDPQRALGRTRIAQLSDVVVPGIAAALSHGAPTIHLR